MKDKKAREDIEDLEERIEKLEEILKWHRHEAETGIVYSEYV
jgi:BMFP domain-containing protein YqiC